jgi:hypothetical protein
MKTSSRDGDKVLRLIIFKFWDSAKAVREYRKPLTLSVEITNLSPSFSTSLT